MADDAGDAGDEPMNLEDDRHPFRKIAARQIQNFWGAWRSRDDANKGARAPAPAGYGAADETDRVTPTALRCQNLSVIVEGETLLRRANARFLPATMTALVGPVRRRRPESRDAFRAVAAASPSIRRGSPRGPTQAHAGKSTLLTALAGWLGGTGDRAETLPVGPDVSMCFKRTASGVNRCQNQRKRRSYG